MTKREVEEYIMSQIFPNASHEVTAKNVRNAFAPIVEQVWTYLEGRIGDLSQLQTTDKQSVVNAINAVLSKLNHDITLAKQEVVALGSKVGELTDSVMQKINPVNWWNPLTDIHGVKKDGTIVDQSWTWLSCARVKVSEGDIIHLYQWRTSGGVTKYYDAPTSGVYAYAGFKDGVAVPSAGVSDKVIEYVVPDGIDEVYVTITTAQIPNIMLGINVTELPSHKEEYHEPVYSLRVDKTLSEDNIPANSKSVGDAISAINADLSNQISNTNKTVSELSADMNNLLAEKNWYDGLIRNDGSIIDLEYGGHSEYIPCKPNDTIVWKWGESYPTKAIFMVLYDSSYTLIGYRQSQGSGSSRTVTLTEQDLAYVVCSFIKSQKESASVAINGEIAYRPSDAGRIANLEEKVDSIIGHNIDDKGAVIKNYYAEYADITVLEKNKGGSGKSLCFVQVTDTHGHTFHEVAEFVDNTEASFLVHTGDIVADKFSDDYTFASNEINNMNKSCYVVLGNHDGIGSASVQDRFNKYFLPINDHNNVVGNKTYYSVNFTEEQVKCIFLDYYDAIEDASLNMNYYIHMTKMTFDQISWFLSELDEANASGYAVICFIHLTPDYVGQRKDGWYDYRCPDACKGVDFLATIIDCFINAKPVSFSHNGIEYTHQFVKKRPFCRLGGWAYALRWKWIVGEISRTKYDCFASSFLYSRQARLNLYAEG